MPEILTTFPPELKPLNTKIMETETSATKIRKALERGEKLTALEILSRFNCMNAKGRIFDLRRSGVPIHTEMIKIPSGKRIAQYSIITSKN